MFMLFEVGEEVLEASAFVAQFCPVIIGHCLTAVVHLVIDSTGSSQAFPTRQVVNFVFERFLQILSVAID